MYLPKCSGPWITYECYLIFLDSMLINHNLQIITFRIWGIIVLVTTSNTLTGGVFSLYGNIGIEYVSACTNMKHQCQGLYISEAVKKKPSFIA